MPSLGEKCKSNPHNNHEWRYHPLSKLTVNLWNSDMNETQSSKKCLNKASKAHLKILLKTVFSPDASLHMIGLLLPNMNTTTLHFLILPFPSKPFYSYNLHIYWYFNRFSPFHNADMSHCLRRLCCQGCCCFMSIYLFIFFLSTLFNAVSMVKLLHMHH